MPYSDFTLAMALSDGGSVKGSDCGCRKKGGEGGTPVSQEARDSPEVVSLTLLRVAKGGEVGHCQCLACEYRLEPKQVGTYHRTDAACRTTLDTVSKRLRVDVVCGVQHLPIWNMTHDNIS